MKTLIYKIRLLFSRNLRAMERFNKNTERLLAAWIWFRDENGVIHIPAKKTPEEFRKEHIEKIIDKITFSCSTGADLYLYAYEACILKDMLDSFSDQSGGV